MGETNDGGFIFAFDTFIGAYTFCRLIEVDVGGKWAAFNG